MDTHRDSSHLTAARFMDRLKERAAEDEPLSQITAGKEGEPTLAKWNYGGVSIRQLPPDEQGILRISIGGGETPVPLNYLVFRGSHGACVDLLRKSLAALEAGPGE